MLSDKKYLYRYVDYDAVVILDRYLVIKDNPQSYWVIHEDLEYWSTNPELVAEHKKLVRKNAVRSFAHDTKEKAFKSYVVRKKKQLVHLSYKLKCVKLIVEFIEKGIPEEKVTNLEAPSESLLKFY